MEHLPSPQKFLMEVARVLRVGGVLILSVPFMEPIHEEPRCHDPFTPFSLHLTFGGNMDSLFERYGNRVGGGLLY